MKKTIRLTENGLHRLIKESVKRVLKEAYQDKYEHATEALEFYAYKVHDGHVLSDDQLTHIQELYDFLKDTNANDNYELTNYWLPLAKNLLDGKHPEEGLPDLNNTEMINNMF